MNRLVRSRHWLAFVSAALGLGVAVAITGCGDGMTKSRAGDGHIAVNVQDKVSATIHPALHGTVGEFAILLNAGPTPVEGWGVVAGLAETGSGSMEPKVRELLINRLLVSKVGSPQNNTQHISPERILESNQIAAVEIRGLIPPLARKGTVFDLYVNALPNSGAKSLENGLLWTADLKMRGLVLDGSESGTIAMGRGPVFIPDALENVTHPLPETEAPRALRTGRVLAGGVCAEDRPIHLQLYTPSFRMTAAIDRAINAHFPSRNPIDRVATAENDSVISLRIPREFTDDPMEFVDICRHLYLTSEQPGFNQMKAKELVEAMRQPDAPHRNLSLALQGLGTSVLPDYVQRYYTDPDAELRFWTARAGANMLDVKGMTLLQETIKDSSSAFRKPALLALIEASRGRDSERATLALMEMLRSPNTDERIMAYHGLLAIRSRAVASYSVGRKFMIDIVPADSPPLIYVLQADSPRIAFIGRPVNLQEGALYISGDKLLTVSVAAPEEIVDGANAARTAMALAAAPLPVSVQPKENVTLHWRHPLAEMQFILVKGEPRIMDKSVSLKTTSRIPNVVARLGWIPDTASPDFDAQNPEPYIGATYQRVTAMLAQMCAEKMLDAKFVAQRAPEGILSPAEMMMGGRPEGSTEIKPPPPPQQLDGGPAIVPVPGAPVQ